MLHHAVMSTDSPARKPAHLLKVGEFDWWSLGVKVRVRYRDGKRSCQWRIGSYYFGDIIQGESDYDDDAQDFTRPNAEDFKAARRKLEERMAR